MSNYFVDLGAVSKEAKKASKSGTFTMPPEVINRGRSYTVTPMPSVTPLGSYPPKRFMPVGVPIIKYPLGDFLPGGPVSIAIVAGILLYFFVLRDDSRTRSRRRAKARTNKEGWYLMEYNYPKSHVDRRLKGYQGPFNSASEARNHIDDVWYTDIQYRKSSPW